MKRLWIALLLALALPAATADASRFSLGPDSLKLVSEKRVDARHIDLTFTTPAVSGPTNVSVLLPRNYATQRTRRWGVLYALHGATEDNTAWLAKGDIERVTANSPFLVVIPSSGAAAGYLDWYNNGAGGPPMWETYHLGQLLPWIDRHFRTRADRTARALVGPSMGGYGAMEYAARHPDMFVAALSLSGAVDNQSIFLKPLSVATLGAFGPFPLEEIRLRGHNPVDLARNLGDGLDLFLRTGNGLPGGPANGGLDTGDPVEMEVHSESVSLHRRLGELGIAHVWEDYGPASHSYYYWTPRLRDFAHALPAIFGTPRPAPDPVVYRTIDDRFEVFGWDVAIDRPALEFAQLHASRLDFSLAGSGAATITTPPLYRAGATLHARVLDYNGIATRDLHVGRDCRLTVPVSLGPGNPDQEYSPQAQANGVLQTIENPGPAPSSGVQSGTEVRTAQVRLQGAVPPCR